MLRNEAVLAWKDIHYTVKVGKEEREILKGISGYARPGELLAIIGSTGCGKSTLLDILAGRNKTGNISGNVTVNDMPAKKIFKSIGAYVAQEDVMMGNLTVRETITFSARLKLHTSKEQQDHKVNDVIEKFGLSKVADSRIGTAVRRGISGGEKKRAAISSEFITDPSLILLDEPTSGLDSVTAYTIVEQLKNLAHKDGKTVITTIHQPSGKMFKMFDKLLILSHGHVIYFGNSASAVQYFGDNLGKVCGQYENPADFFLEAVDEIEEMGQIEKVIYKEPPLDVQLSDEEDNTSTRPIKFKKSNMLNQFLYLVWRNVLNITRDPRTTYAQLGQSIFLALLIGSIYFGIKLDQKSIQNRMGAIFFIITNQAFGGFPLLSLFLEERELFKRERAGGLYNALPYYLAKLLTELPILLFYPIFFSSIAYWMIGFRPEADKFFMFCLSIIVMNFTTSSLFVLVGSIVPNIQLANVFAPLVLVLFMIFGGFFLNADNIPSYYVWLKYLSFFKWTYEVLLVNEMKGLHFTCTGSQGCIPTGDLQLLIMGMGDVNIPINLAILASMAVFYRVLGFFAVLFLHVEKK
uniref:ABC transporter domain-containing protein n=1 Tax=Arcella intermedia TaxID=1963864 RepID=A0A6B2L0A8_9EUKA